MLSKSAYVNEIYVILLVSFYIKFGQCFFTCPVQLKDMVNLEDCFQGQQSHLESYNNMCYIIVYKKNVILKTYNLNISKVVYYFFLLCLIKESSYIEAAKQLWTSALKTTSGKSQRHLFHINQYFTITIDYCTLEKQLPPFFKEE